MARILIVEDDISIAHAYETELVRAGYRVDVANDGISALDTLSADHDMIILDILMPKLDGIGFMQLATHNRHGRVPTVIVLSNVDEPELREAARQMGAKQYFLKVDITPSHLADTVADNLK